MARSRRFRATRRPSTRARCLTATRRARAIGARRRGSPGHASPAPASRSGDGYRGVVIPRAGSPVAVVTSDRADGAAQSSFAYAAPAGAVHVVVGAPVDASGKSDVSATLDGSNCRVTLTPHAGSSGGY